MDGAEEKPAKAGIDTSRGPKLGRLVRYFFKLGAIGFGGPVALVGYMRRDLVEKRAWVNEEHFKLSLALAQIMPGPLAAQTAIAIGYFQEGLRGATLGGIAFILPSFLIVIAISIAYAAFGGLWWMQALFYGIGAAVIAIIAIAAFKLSRSTNKRDPLSWGICLVVMLITYFTRSEIAWVFILAGLAVLFLRAPPRWLKQKLPFLSIVPFPVIAAASGAVSSAAPASAAALILPKLFIFFVKAGAFVFGSGLAIVPFLHLGVVQQNGWLTERQFLDAVAVAMITPGPVVITVVFIGYLVARIPGAIVSGIGIFLPVWLFTVIPAQWFRKHRDNPQLRAFVQGATAAATGAIIGSVLLLGQKAIFDLPTIAIAGASLFALLVLKLPEPLLVAAAGAIGLTLRFLAGRIG